MGTSAPTQTGRIRDEHLLAYREDGFAFVHDFLSAEEVEAARTGAASYFPTGAEFDATPRRYAHLTQHMNLEPFPVAHPGLVHVIFHPDLVGAARTLLGTDDILLSQTTLMAKYAGNAEFDQPHHLDYPNNTLVVPDDGEFNMITSIIYLTDVTEDLGPTSVVSQQVTGRDLWPTSFTREERPEWYDAEESAVVPAGTLLLYDVRTFHRGTAFKASTGARFTQHVGFQSASNTWGGWRDWAKFGHNPLFYEFIQSATVEQRTLIGFPAPGHPFWTEATLAATAQRYPDMDLTPYRSA